MLMSYLISSQSKSLHISRAFLKYNQHVLHWNASIDGSSRQSGFHYSVKTWVQACVFVSRQHVSSALITFPNLLMFEGKWLNYTLVVRGCKVVKTVNLSNSSNFLFVKPHSLRLRKTKCSRLVQHSKRCFKGQWKEAKFYMSSKQNKQESTN